MEREGDNGKKIRKWRERERKWQENKKWRENKEMEKNRERMRK